MPDKSPNHKNVKKAGKTLKEKRSDKKSKKAEHSADRLATLRNPG